jgi:hypothetical protein
MSILTSDHIAGWYLLRKKAANIFDQNIQPYFLLGDLTNTTSTSFSPAQLIQGEAGNIVIDNNGSENTLALSGSPLIINTIPGANLVYKDILDLLIEDYYGLLSFFFLPMTDINNSANQVYYDALINALGLNVASPNLLESASIQISESPSVSLSYKCKYDQKFQITFNNVAQNVYGASDFIARTAKNYDCRFYIDSNEENSLQKPDVYKREYKIKSATIQINIGYSKNYFANVRTQFPFYSPQSHSVSGSLEIIAPYNAYDTIPTSGNCSLLIGDRYLELGQASVKSKYNRKLAAGGDVSVISIDFTAYARIGAGVDSTRWNSYYNNILLRNTSSTFDLIRGFLGV